MVVPRCRIVGVIRDRAAAPAKAGGRAAAHHRHHLRGQAPSSSSATLQRHLWPPKLWRLRRGAPPASASALQLLGA